MVQRKVTKKPKVKSEATLSDPLVKKQEKKTLSNGYGKTQPKRNPKSDETPTETPEPTNDTSLSGTTENGEKSDLPKPVDSAGTSTELSKNTHPSNNSEEIAKSKEMAKSNEGNPRKRKLVKEKEETSKVTEKKSTITKSKAKKQKIVLEVPSLSSITGKVFVVGENDVGQIGLDEDVDSKEKPYLLNLPYSIIDIAAGGMHSVCLTENGEVITFGCNDEGALGRVASEEEERIPKRVEIPEKIVQISAGDSHSAALAESGQVYLWGNFRNGEGQMGLTPDRQKRVAPVKVLTDKTIVKIASGGDHLACLSNDGTLYTCGCAEQGQLGRINPRACKDGGRQKGLAALLEPDAVILKPKKPVSDVWAESYATFIKVQETGSIYTFGLNNYNQLGLRNRNDDQENQMVFFPQSVPSFNNKSWLQINGGQHHTLALDNNGIVYSLGRSDYGRLGLGTDHGDRSEPTVVPTLENEKCNSISCGNVVSFAVTEQGSLYSWGMSSSQLGHGSSGNEEDINIPRLMKGDKGELSNSWEVLKVSGGGQHALILACPRKGSSKDSKA